MKIIGANICLKPSGKKLRDAGVCLLDDGRVIAAIAEERLTRLKHDSGIRKSFDYCLSVGNCTLNEIDLFVFSICGAKPLTKDYVQAYLKHSSINIPLSKIIVCPSHHLSHAASAFFASGIKDSLIVVADRDGSVLDGDEDETYANSVEHMSYYIGCDTNISLLERDDDMFGDLGIGLGYSYVTEWLGFDGHAMAGKTMALAAYGKTGALAPAHFFEFRNNKIHCLLEPTDNNKSLAVRRLIYKATGKDIGAHCTDLNSEDAFNVARLVQDDLENVMIQKLRYLKEKTGLKNLCFAGGVALNCRLNYVISKSGLFENFFVQPAAGDTGQCLGNALYGYHMLCGQPRSWVMRDAYYGKQYSESEVEEIITKYQSRLQILKVSNIYESVSELLFNGKIVAWFQGRSEFGPRALGNRSILANPSISNMRDRLNQKVKHREWFRPFGICILQDCVTEYLDFKICNPYMLTAPQVLPSVRHIIPSAVHVDGSCRIQTTNKDDNPSLYSLLKAFQRRSGVPILINTSFNIKGEPIVETPADAIKCFLSTEIDYLIIYNNIISKHDAL